MITFILGGARSGKSEIAERLAAASAHDNGCGVTYLATMTIDGDASAADRVAAHRARRPASWITVEAAADLPGALREAAGTVLLDSLGPWVAIADDFAADIEGLCAALTFRTGDTIVVSDEVGLGVVPATVIGGAFRDALGSVNRAVAAVADRALLVVAGLVVPLTAAPER